jgi:hypothetical protein
MEQCLQRHNCGTVMVIRDRVQSFAEFKFSASLFLCSVMHLPSRHIPSSVTSGGVLSNDNSPLHYYHCRPSSP